MSYTSSQAMEARATHLAHFTEGLVRDLVEVRENRGLSQADVAERMGISQSAVSQFERYDSNPKLSTIRRYAHAVGARIKHSVILDAELQSSEWNSLALSALTARWRQALQNAEERGPEEWDAGWTAPTAARPSISCVATSSWTRTVTSVR